MNTVEGCDLQQLSSQVESKDHTTFSRLQRVGLALGAAVLTFSPLVACGTERSAENHQSSSIPGETTSALSAAEKQKLNRRNLLLVVVDDMNDWQCDETYRYLPRSKKSLLRGARCFENAQVITPSCCQSRSTIMTGQMPHNDQVRRQSDGYKLNIHDTVQYLLRERGYHTGIVGKYLNGVSSQDLNSNKFDAGFSETKVWDSYSYSNYLVADKSGEQSIIKTNSNVYTGENVIEMIERASEKNKPWFINASFRGVHTPMDGTVYPSPTKRHKNTPVPPFEPRFEADSSDKLPIFQNDISRQKNYIITSNKKRVQSLYDIDYELSKIYGRLQKLGIVDKTDVIFVSDNGNAQGDHNRTAKLSPYGVDLNVPLLIKSHALAPGVDERLANTTDIAPTILGMLGLRHLQPKQSFDGYDLTTATAARTFQIAEYFKDTSEEAQHESGKTAQDMDSWFQLNSVKDGVSYIEWFDQNGRTFHPEYYDSSDQLDNLLHNKVIGRTPSPASIIKMHQLVARLRLCAGTTTTNAANPCP